MVKGKTKRKYVFFIRSVDIDKINSKYNFKGCNIPDNNLKSPNMTTKLSAFSTNEPVTSISFLDESKNNHVCNVSMIDFRKCVSVNDKGYKCFWCRNKFESVGIGCPVEYISPNVHKNYFSEITKTQYSINQSVSAKNFTKISGEDKLKWYFKTDGVFCSFNCCLAYINANKKNKIYFESLNLLNKMYKMINNGCKNKILPAPHWRTLEEYGGNLSIEKFRNGFSKVNIVGMGMIDSEILFSPLIHIFEENIKF